MASAPPSLSLLILFLDDVIKVHHPCFSANSARRLLAIERSGKDPIYFFQTRRVSDNVVHLLCRQANRSDQMGYLA